MTSDGGKREITSEAEIEETLLKPGGIAFAMSVTVVAKSLSIYGWPAVTVTPLPTPAVTTLHLLRPSSRQRATAEGDVSKVQDTFFQLPRYGTLMALNVFPLSLPFFLLIFADGTTESARKADERAVGCGREDNEGHQRGGDTPPRLR